MSDEPKVSFRVTAKDPAAEIFLIDGNFHLVDRGIGSKTFEVPPGVYKIKQRAGNITSETLYAVRPGMKDVELPPVRFASPMPLQDTAKSHEFHQAAAVDVSTRIDVDHGKGSGIVLMVRDWTSSDLSKVDKTNIPDPSRGLKLRDFAGNVIADYEALAKKDLQPEPWATFHLSVDPGAYRLTLDRPDGVRVDQTIIACNGWDTQIFLLLDRAQDRQLCADLVHGAITMVPSGTKFDPQSEDRRAEELARLSLADGLTVLPPDLRSKATSASASPMLALLGAHVIIREARNAKSSGKEPIDNTAEVRMIVESLRKMIGDHPDVEAIAIRAGARNPNYVFTAPPMLRDSWVSLLRASIDAPELIPAQSFCARIADRIWGDGPWTLWVDPDQTTATTAAAWHSSARSLLQHLSVAAPAVAQTAVAQAEAAPSAAAPLPPSGTVRDALDAVKKIFTRTSRSHRPFPSDDDLHPHPQTAEVKVNVEEARAALRDADNRKEVVRRLGIPISCVNEWLNNLDK
jgi:hypothetical protein